MKKIVPFLCLISFISCQNNFDDRTLEKLLSGTHKSHDPISKEDTLYNYLKLISEDPETGPTDIGCIEFLYPFVLFQFDDGDNYIDLVSIQGNEDFAHFLNNLSDGHSISLSYPISGSLADGTLVEVNNNEELQKSLESCIEEKLEIFLGECNDIIEDCIWKITQSSQEESPYIGSFFAMKNDGSVIFSVLENHEDDANTEDGNDESTDDEGSEQPNYIKETGTWVFYYIGPDLHLNIHLGPNESEEEGASEETNVVRSDWNFDWKIIYIDPVKIEIQKTFTQKVASDQGEVEGVITENIILEKECEDYTED
ncbi:MAG: hypothetical protein AB3N16_01910 [Flavobacteriaceae bacterium]